MPKEKRRRELERIRDAQDGSRRITGIFDRRPISEVESVTIRGSFVRRMIEEILKREFPE